MFYRRRGLKLKRLAVSLGVVSLLLLSGIPIILISNVPPVSALGCYPSMGDWGAEGPYSSSLRGFTNVERGQGSQVNGGAYYIYTVNPGEEASMKFAFKVDYFGRPAISNLTLRPVAGAPAPSAVNSVLSWLSVFFGPSVVVVPDTGGVNVTAVLKVSKDAPLGTYPLMFYGEPQNFDDWEKTHCQYAPLNFALRIAPENANGTVTQSTTITATTTLTSTTTVTTTERVAEPSTYAWAVGATVVAAVLAIVALRRRS